MGVFLLKTFSQPPKTVNRVVSILTWKIDPNPAQPRVHFDEEEIASLAESIQKNGLLQPLTVRRNKDTGRYVLISGERRLRALKYAEIREAPCIILNTSDLQAALFALIENIERQNLNYFEEAAAIKSLMTEWGISQQEVGEKLGRAQPTIANKIRLLRFSKEEAERLIENQIPERHARALLPLAGTDLFKQAVARLSEHHLSADETERMVIKMVQSLPEDAQPRKMKKRPIIKDIRLFANTVNRAVSLMKESGLDVDVNKTEHDNCIEYVIRIPI